MICCSVMWMIPELKLRKTHEVEAFTSLGSLGPFAGQLEEKLTSQPSDPPTPNHARRQAGAALWPSAVFAEHVGE